MRTDFIPTDIAMVLNSYFRNTRAIKTRCYLCDTKFDDLIRIRQDDFPEYDVIKIETSRSDEYLHGIYMVQEPDTGTELGIFHVIQKNDELYVLSGERSQFMTKIVYRIFRSLHPYIVSVFVHANEIYEILENFEKIKNFQLVEKKFIPKRIFGIAPRVGVIYETSKKERIYPNFREAFSWANDNKQWIDRIKVNGKQEYTDLEIQFSISRKGEVTIETGTIDTIFSNVLSQISDLGKSRMQQFSGRSRSEQIDKKPRPLIVKFGKDVFETLETRKEFTGLLENYPNCNYSIIHSGNPHVYLSVLDRLDDSSFSIRSLGTASLLVIPQIKTSPIALMRFSEFLISFFHEGTIQNYVYEKNR